MKALQKLSSEKLSTDRGTEGYMVALNFFRVMVYCARQWWSQRYAGLRAWAARYTWINLSFVITFSSTSSTTSFLSERVVDQIPRVDAHHLSSPMQPSPNENLSASRHLVFDSFSLKASDGTMRHPTTAESDMIMALFPTTFSVGFLPPVLIIRCVNLPPKPWPVTVAGVPAWFTSDEDTYPVPLGMTGLKGKALADYALPLWKTPTTSEFTKVLESLHHDFGVEALSVLWTGIRFIITIPIGTTLGRKSSSIRRLATS
jgi:hypothetical protein